MAGLIRQGHFLGPKLRTLRKRNGLTLDELSARCVQLDAAHAPSVSYLSMVETGKRMPSPELLELLAAVFGKDRRWFLDQNADVEPNGSTRRDTAPTMPLEPAFLFSKEVLQNALPELLAQTGTSGNQFARLLVRVWQETHQNDFPDIERAAETAGSRQMPLSLDALLDIARKHGLSICWFDEDTRKPGARPLRARFEAPGIIHINRQLRGQDARMKYEVAFFLGHRILHDGDGVIPPRYAAGLGLADTRNDDVAPGMDARDMLLAWRDFECTVFAGALLCPRVPFRQFLAREHHRLSAYDKLGVTPAVVMRRMTAVSPYRHWHFFDGYPPGYLQAVYRGNGIPLPWGNMSLVPDPCPRWAVFRLLQSPAATRGPGTGKQARPAAPTSQISIMDDGRQPRLYCCHSLVARDSTDTVHVMSVGVDLAPALDAQGFDSAEVIESIAAACRRGGGDGTIPFEAATRIKTVAHVLNIAWIADALDSPACVICPRSRACPRPSACTTHRSA